MTKPITLRRWTPEEDKFLLDNLDLKREVEIARALKRTARSIRNRRVALGIRYNFPPPIKFRKELQFQTGLELQKIWHQVANDSKIKRKA